MQWDNLKHIINTFLRLVEIVLQEYETFVHTQRFLYITIRLKMRQIVFKQIFSYIETMLKK